MFRAIDRLIAKTLAPIILILCVVTRQTLYGFASGAMFLGMMGLLWDFHATEHHTIIWFILAPILWACGLLAFIMAVFRPNAPMTSNGFLRTVWVVLFSAMIVDFFVGVEHSFANIATNTLFLLSQYALVIASNIIDQTLAKSNK